MAEGCSGAVSPLASRVDEEGADGVIARLLSYIRGVGDEEAVFRGGRELVRDADIVEGDGDERLGGGVLQSELDEFSGMELEVFDCFGAHEDRIGPTRERRHQVCRSSPLKVGVLEKRRLGDGRGADAEQVLKIASHVRVPVLERFYGCDARCGSDRRGSRRSDVGAGGLRHGDVGSVGEAGVDFGLMLIGGVEDRSGKGECQGESEHHPSPRQERSLT